MGMGKGCVWPRARNTNSPEFHFLEEVTKNQLNPGNVLKNIEKEKWYASNGKSVKLQAEWVIIQCNSMENVHAGTGEIGLGCDFSHAEIRQEHGQMYTQLVSKWSAINTEYNILP